MVERLEARLDRELEEPPTRDLLGFGDAPEATR
jgi:hypothetical protein